MFTACKCDKTTVSGKILDINNTAIANAKVTLNGKTIITNAEGYFSYANEQVSNRVVINVSHPEYLSNTRIVKTSEEFNTSIDIKLDKAKESLTFSAGDGAEITQGSASVKLPKNGYIDAEGNSYIGEVTVKMAYYPITTQSGRDAFPGTFEAKEGNSTFPIQSYGFMNVELSDTKGNPLNLADGEVATLTYPVDDALSNPSSVPLWYFDTVSGYWVEDGKATRDGHGHYKGTVTHFTSWNLDVKGVKAKLTGCVEDENGLSIANAQVQFRSINWDSYTVPTDANGDVSVINILAEADLTFSAYTKIGTTFYYGEYPTFIYLNEYEDRTVSPCVIIKPMHSLPGTTITVTGKLVDYTGKVYPSEPVEIWYIKGFKVAEGLTDENGNFSITFQTTDSLQYIINGKTIYLQNNKTLYDLGDVNIDYGELK